mgnify:CR=1 FL=1
MQNASKIEGDRNIFRKAKRREMPLVGEFRVYHYDENDDFKLATNIVFTTRVSAEEYMRNNVDPKTDPYIAHKKED